MLKTETGGATDGAGAATSGAGAGAPVAPALATGLGVTPYTFFYLCNVKSA